MFAAMHAPGMRCQAAGALAWLGRRTALCSVNQGTVSQPRLAGKDRRHSLFFVMQSPAPLCAGAAVACLNPC